MIRHNLTAAVKVCDVFSGKPIERANISLPSRAIRFTEKGNGFYVISDLPTGAYTFRIQADGYDSKELHFHTEKDELYAVCFLTPSHDTTGFLIRGKITCDDRCYGFGTFYYSMDTLRYRGVVMEDLQENAERIQFHFYSEESLEGRKFAAKEGAEIFTLGSFDYIEKKYALQNQSKMRVKQGSFVYLLLENKTDAQGTFVIYLPKYLVNQEEMEMAFFLNGKHCSKKISFCEREITLHLEF